MDSHRSVCLVFYQYINRADNIQYIVPERPTAETAGELQATLDRIRGLQHTHQITLPTRYVCGRKDDADEILYNNIGWLKADSCQTEISSLHYFESPQCVTLRVASVSPGEPVEGERLRQMDVKVGLAHMEKVSQLVDTEGVTLKYCRKDPQKIAAKPEAEIVSVGWVDGRRYAEQGLKPVRLLSIEKGG